MMVGQVMKASFHVDRLRCLHECYVNEQCLSYNFEPSTGGKELCQLNRCRVKDDHERGFTHMKFSIYLLFYLLTFFLTYLLTYFIYLFVYACMFVCLYVCVY